MLQIMMEKKKKVLRVEMNPTAHLCQACLSIDWKACGVKRPRVCSGSD